MSHLKNAFVGFLLAALLLSPLASVNAQTTELTLQEQLTALLAQTTTSELQAQINALLAQIAALQNSKGKGLSIIESDENPEASEVKTSDTGVSEEYTLFAFEIANDSDSYIDVTKLTIQMDIDGKLKTSDVIDHATLSVDGEEYNASIQKKVDGSLIFKKLGLEIDKDDSAEFELQVSFKKAAGAYADGTQFEFELDSDDVKAQGVKSKNIAGSAYSETHTLTTDVTDTSDSAYLESVSTSEAVVTLNPASSSYGVYTIKYDVTAVGSDIYVPMTSDAAEKTSPVGAVYAIVGTPTFQGKKSSTLTSTADRSGNYHVVREGETETFTLTATLDPSISGEFRVGLSSLGYATTAKTPDQWVTIGENDGDYQTGYLSIPDTSVSPKTTLEVHPIPSKEIAGSGRPLAFTWMAKNVPANAIVCTSLIEQNTGKSFLFPSGVECGKAKNGVDGRLGTLIRTSGYDLGPGSYKLSVNISAAPAGGKDGANLAQGYSNVMVLTAPTTDDVRKDTYRGYLNGSATPFITTANITEATALANCKLNAGKNPTSSIRCTWGNKEIYSKTSASTTRLLCGLYRGGTDEGKNMIASPNPDTSIADTDAACIKYCDASGNKAGDKCIRGTGVIKTYSAPGATSAPTMQSANALSALAAALEALKSLIAK